MLSDGVTNRGPDPVAVAESAPDDVTIHTIGLGHGIDEGELQAIADATDGDFYHVADEGDLPDAFERVAENRSEFADTDDDGLPDVVENASLSMVVGLYPAQPISLDFEDPDTDGDGLEDGEEILEYEITEIEGEDGTEYEVSVVSAVSNPTFVDTDGDGLDDATEVEGWTVDVVTDSAGDPYRYDYDDESGAEIHVDSSPTFEDTDSDGLADDLEHEARTDPRSKVTYGVTEDHQTEIVDALAAEWENDESSFMGISTPLNPNFG